MRGRSNRVFFNRYINGSKGVISLFLALLMTPFLSIAGALINAAKFNSTLAIFDEALCNASNSALGTYDEFLRSRFGLMAISQDPEKVSAQLGVSAVGYTAEDFVQELFVYYMEENLGALGDAYDETTLSATGVYPLGDERVLKAAILQTSKITVPSEMAVEWTSLEDFMSMLTKPFSVFAAIEDTLAGGADVVSAIDKLTGSQEDLEKQIDACNTARSEYSAAYNEFASAITNFNSLVDNINAAQEAVNTCQQEVDRLEELVADINDDIDEKEEEIKELESDTENDRSGEIAVLENEIAQLKEDREEITPNYDQAVADLTSAKRVLNDCVNQYSGKRQAVADKKSNYNDKIVALQNAIYTASQLAEEFQSAAKELVTNATGFASTAVQTGLKIAQSNCDEQVDQLEEENKEYSEKVLDAQTSTDTRAEMYFESRIQENNEAIQTYENNKIKYENIEDIADGAEKTFSDVYGDLAKFAERNLKAEYKTIYDALEDRRNNLNAITIPNNYSKVNYTKDSIYITVTNPLEKAEISEILDEIENQIVNNSGWAIIQLIFGFFDALTSLSLSYDYKLQAEIDTSLYSENGGLPSQISRTEYPVTNPYASQDGEKALGYKQVLNTYSSENVYEVPGEEETTADTVVGYIETIKQYISPFELKNLGKLWDAAKGLVDCLLDMGTSFLMESATTGLEGMRDRLYVVGYASYYTANRTTYTGKALTGAGFDLPKHGTEGGYVFNGAELEYIISGGLIEKDNQVTAFNIIWVERMIFNLSGVLGDTLVQSLANALGAVLPVVGQLVVYLAFLLVEGYIDAVILANGEDIPMIKSCIYLSPTGMTKLIEKIFSLGISEDKMKDLYNRSTKVATEINNGTNELVQNMDANFTNKVNVSYSDYDTAKAEQDKIDKENKYKDKFTLDYTKSLQIYMYIFGNSDKYVKRIADIIQMEASYEAYDEDITSYNFNLDKSYTYIRASGSFSAGVFMRISEDDSNTYENRVVYNGY